MEELAASVDTINSLVREPSMQISLYCDSIVREEQSMDVETERDRGISKFSNTIHRIKPTCHTNLNHSITERPNVGDDIHISCTNISGTEINLLNLLVKPFKLGPDLISLTRSPLIHERLEHVLVVFTLLVELRSALGKFLLRFTLFTQPHFLLTLRLLFGLFSVLIPERQVEFFEAERMVPAIYPQVDERTKTLHLVTGALKSFASRLTIAGLDSENTVLNFSIIGTQHHLRHVSNKLTPLRCRVIERESLSGSDRHLTPNHLLDLRTHLREASTKL